MKYFIFLLVSLIICSSISAQPYTPAAENLKAREWFGNARYGLFIHWGPFSIPGAGEWVMN